MKFFHRFPGAKFFMPDGKEVAFAGGEIETNEIKDKDQREALEKELTKVANVPSSMIYTKDPIPDASEAAVVEEIKETATKGFDGDKNIPAGAETVAMPQTEVVKPVLNKPGQTGHSPAKAAAERTMQDRMNEARKAVANAGGVTPVHQPQNPTPTK